MCVLCSLKLVHLKTPTWLFIHSNSSLLTFMYFRTKVQMEALTYSSPLFFSHFCSIPFPRHLKYIIWDKSVSGTNSYIHTLSPPIPMTYKQWPLAIPFLGVKNFVTCPVLVNRLWDRLHIATGSRLWAEIPRILGTLSWSGNYVGGMWGTFLLTLWKVIAWAEGTWY